MNYFRDIDEKLSNSNKLTFKKLLVHGEAVQKCFANLCKNKIFFV